MYSLAVLIVGIVSVCFAYPDGAGEPACSNGLVPIHGGNAQTSQSPFTLVTPPDYSQGSSIQVTLRGNRPFKGFLLVATDNPSPDNPLAFRGNFTVEQGKTQNVCGGKALTHTQRLNVQELVVTWTAPRASQTALGKIRFFATFVEQQSTYWTAVSSNELSVIADVMTTAGNTQGSTTAGQSTTNTATTQGSTANSVTTGGSTSSSSSDSSTTSQPTTTTTRRKGPGGTSPHFSAEIFLIASLILAKFFL